MVVPEVALPLCAVMSTLVLGDVVLTAASPSTGVVMVALTVASNQSPPTLTWNLRPVSRNDSKFCASAVPILSRPTGVTPARAGSRSFTAAVTLAPPLTSVAATVPSALLSWKNAGRVRLGSTSAGAGVTSANWWPFAFGSAAGAGVDRNKLRNTSRIGADGGSAEDSKTAGGAACGDASALARFSISHRLRGLISTVGESIPAVIGPLSATTRPLPGWCWKTGLAALRSKYSSCSPRKCPTSCARRRESVSTGQVSWFARPPSALRVMWPWASAGLSVNSTVTCSWSPPGSRWPWLNMASTPSAVRALTASTSAAEAVPAGSRNTLTV